MKLEDIGFYTLSDKRCKNASSSSRLMRGEIILTGRCNFSCPYCRHVGGPDRDSKSTIDLIDQLAKEGLFAIRFSGGEPTMHPRLPDFVMYSRWVGIKKIAISTNGSVNLEFYKRLLDLGVNDFSISLDACCAEDGDRMSGGIKGAWNKVVNNIRELSKLTYVTVGVVLTEENLPSINDIITFASGLGVADIRIIPAAQNGDKLQNVKVDAAILAKHPILRYRINNIQQNIPVRGLSDSDSGKCAIVLDDLAVMGDYHYPCIIYMRESGKPIGKIGPNMRKEREEWYNSHDCQKDEICKKNCLDCIVLYNNKYQENRCS